MSNTPLVERPRATQVVAQTVGFCREHGRALGPAAILAIFQTLASAMVSTHLSSPDSPLWAPLTLLMTQAAAMLVWWVWLCFGAALVETRAWALAWQRCGQQTRALGHLAALQLALAAAFQRLRVEEVQVRA